MPHFFIEISDLTDDFASHDELDVRARIEEAIVSQSIGRIAGSGSGFGAMDLSVETPDVDGIEARLTSLVAAIVPIERVTIREMVAPDLQEEDRDQLNVLGAEIGPEPCKRPSCGRLRIAMSVFCRRHHFEQIWGRPPSCGDTV